MTKPTYLTTTLALCDRVEAHDRATIDQECDDIAKACAVAIANTADAKFVSRAVSLEAKYQRARTDAPALAARVRVMAEVMAAVEAVRVAHDAWADDDYDCYNTDPLKAADDKAHDALIAAYRAAVAKLEGMP